VRGRGGWRMLGWRIFRLFLRRIGRRFDFIEFRWIGWIFINIKLCYKLDINN
jgi:hypothetical protein